MSFHGVSPVLGGLLLWLATAAAAEEFRFLGPLPVRSYQPIQLIFLQPPFESAATVDGFRFDLDSAESNVIATTQGAIESVLKLETNRTTIAMRWGFAERWEASLHVPFITRYGGFLDPLIDEVEYVFDLGNIERDLFPNNSFGEFDVRRGDQVLFHGAQETFGLGDIVLAAKHELPLPTKWPRLAVRAACKAPTGHARNVLGSGNPDLGLGLAADYRAFTRLMLYANLNVVVPFGDVAPGDLSDGDLSTDPFLTQSFAAELAITRRLSGLLHQATYQSPLNDTGARLLDGTPIEIGFGLNFAWTDSFGIQLLAIDNVSPVEPAADFSFVLALRLGR